MTEPSVRIRYHSLRAVASAQIDIDEKLLDILEKHLREVKHYVWADEIQAMRRRLMMMRAELIGARRDAAGARAEGL